MLLDSQGFLASKPMNKISSPCYTYKIHAQNGFFSKVKKGTPRTSPLLTKLSNWFLGVYDTTLDSPLIGPKMNWFYYFTTLPSPPPFLKLGIIEFRPKVIPFQKYEIRCQYQAHQSNFTDITRCRTEQIILN